jgi:polyisoprenoid-binding protein YceI
MTTAVKNSIPGYLAGTWDIDPVHSDVSFAVRHMMVSKVRGRFATFSGEIVTGDDVTDSSVAASIDPASVDTGNEQRDADLRSARFFDVQNYPLWAFCSTVFGRTVMASWPTGLAPRAYGKCREHPTRSAFPNPAP